MSKCSLKSIRGKEEAHAQVPGEALASDGDPRMSLRRRPRGRCVRRNGGATGDSAAGTPRRRTRKRRRVAGPAPVAPPATAPVSHGRSAAAIVRHRFAALGQAERGAIRERALEYLRPRATGAVPEWLTLTEAAALLRTTPRALKRVFRTPAGQRAFGWPRWRSNRWWIARAAADPRLAPGCFAVLPETEPWPPETLPAWARRETPPARRPDGER